jgi:hypothetical protein
VRTQPELAIIEQEKHERFLAVVIGIGGATAIAIIGYLLNWGSAHDRALNF